jgi:hypothetical protein
MEHWKLQYTLETCQPILRGKGFGKLPIWVTMLPFTHEGKMKIISNMQFLPCIYSSENTIQNINVIQKREGHGTQGIQKQKPVKQASKTNNFLQCSCNLHSNCLAKIAKTRNIL